MNIAVTGATGLVGAELVARLGAAGREVTRLVRPQTRVSSLPGVRDAAWDPLTATIDAAALEGAAAVVHLAGDNVAAGRWTAAKKARIRDSRVQGTQVLAEALARLDRPPAVLVSASAIGFYGSRGETTLDEGSSPGTGFLPDVCREWEAATRPASDRGIRVVNLRIGVVLSPRGGMLAKVLLPFRFGLGGIVGDGKQYLSWIALDDLVSAIEHCIANDGLRGPVNGVGPRPATNREFTRALGRVLSRPTLFPMPAFAARLAFGEMGEELLLGSMRVVPGRLLGSGFTFRYPDLEAALRHLLGRAAA
jgi:hypothetical protein